MNTTNNHENLWVNRKSEEHDLEINWSHFHLGLLQGVFKSFPGFPVETSAKGRVRAIMIFAIQVGFVTQISVPSGSVIPLGTVCVLVVIIILISSCKWFAVMIRERVTGIS